MQANSDFVGMNQTHRWLQPWLPVTLMFSMMVVPVAHSVGGWARVACMGGKSHPVRCHCFQAIRHSKEGQNAWQKVRFAAN